MSDVIRDNVTIFLMALVFWVLSNSNTPSHSGQMIGQGLRVLVVEDTSKRHILPYEQRLALSSQEWRSTIDSAGGQMRKVEPGQDLTGLKKEWQDAAKLVAGKRLPWWIVSNSETKKAISAQFPLTTMDAVRVVEGVLR